MRTFGFTIRITLLFFSMFIFNLSYSDLVLDCFSDIKGDLTVPGDNATLSSVMKFNSRVIENQSTAADSYPDTCGKLLTSCTDDNDVDSCKSSCLLALKQGDKSGCATILANTKNYTSWLESSDIDCTKSDSAISSVKNSYSAAVPESGTATSTQTSSCPAVSICAQGDPGNKAMSDSYCPNFLTSLAVKLGSDNIAYNALTAAYCMFSPTHAQCTSVTGSCTGGNRAACLSLIGIGHSDFVQISCLSGKQVACCALVDSGLSSDQAWIESNSIACPKVDAPSAKDVQSEKSDCEGGQKTACLSLINDGDSSDVQSICRTKGNSSVACCALKSNGSDKDKTWLRVNNRACPASDGGMSALEVTGIVLGFASILGLVAFAMYKYRNRSKNSDDASAFEYKDTAESMNRVGARLREKAREIVTDPVASREYHTVKTPREVLSGLVDDIVRLTNRNFTPTDLESLMGQDDGKFNTALDSWLEDHRVDLGEGNISAARTILKNKYAEYRLATVAADSDVHSKRIIDHLITSEPTVATITVSGASVPVLQKELADVFLDKLPDRNTYVYIEKGDVVYKIRIDTRYNRKEINIRKVSDGIPTSAKGEDPPITLKINDDGSLTYQVPDGHTAEGVITGASNLSVGKPRDLSLNDIYAIKNKMIELGVEDAGDGVVINNDGGSYKVSVDAKGNPTTIEKVVPVKGAGGDVLTLDMTNGKIVKPAGPVSGLGDEVSRARSRLDAFKESRSSVTTQQIIDQLKTSDGELSANASAIETAMNEKKSFNGRFNGEEGSFEYNKETEDYDFSPGETNDGETYDLPDDFNMSEVGVGEPL